MVITRPLETSSQPGASLPPEPVTMTPPSVSVTLRLSPESSALLDLPPLESCGNCASIWTIASTASLVASKNMIKFTTMSRNGMMFSSLDSSEGSGSWTRVRRRMYARCCGLRLGIRQPGSLGPGFERQQVLELHGAALHVAANLLLLSMQHQVEEHADHRDAQTERGVVHGFRDALGEQRGFLRRLGI